MIPKSEKNTKNENYRSIFLMNIDAKSLIKILTERIIYHHNHVEFIDMPH